MIDLAKLIRTDRGLAINETSIREEVTRVMDLERDIANVSAYSCFPSRNLNGWSDLTTSSIRVLVCSLRN